MVLVAGRVGPMTYQPEAQAREPRDHPRLRVGLVKKRKRITPSILPPFGSVFQDDPPDGLPAQEDLCLHARPEQQVPLGRLQLRHHGKDAFALVID